MKMLNSLKQRSEGRMLDVMGRKPIEGRSGGENAVTQLAPVYSASQRPAPFTFREMTREPFER